MKRMGLIALLVLILGIGGFVVKTLGHPSVSAKAPNITSTGTDSNTAHTTSIKQTITPKLTALTSVTGQHIPIDPNKKTVLHFMVSSCGSCISTEMALTKFAHTPDVQIISIDIDPQNDNQNTIQTFKKATGATWDYVMDTNQSLMQKFHITELDTVIVLYHNQVILDQVAPSDSALKKVLA